MTKNIAVLFDRIWCLHLDAEGVDYLRPERARAFSLSTARLSQPDPRSPHALTGPGPHPPLWNLQVYI